MHLALTATAATDAEAHGVFNLAGVPYAGVYAVAFCIVMARAQATYWLGRGVARGTGSTRVAQLLEDPRAQRFIDRVNRFGPPAVTLSFLTVGVQTAVNLAAGYLRMPFGRYLVALTFGSLIWAGIWTTVGIAAFYGALWLALHQPVILWTLTMLVVAALVSILWLRRRRAAAATQPTIT